MKDIELFRRDAIIPAINELRYTGRRVADVLLLLTGSEVLSEQALTRLDEQLIIAEAYLINADHDLTDAVVLNVLLHVDRVIKRHGAAKVQRYIPDYADQATKLEEAQALIKESRADRTRRGDIYSTLAKDYVPLLMALQHRIDAEPKIRLPETETKRGLWILSVLVAIAALANICNFGLSLWTRSHQPDIGAIVTKAVQDAIQR